VADIPSPLTWGTIVGNFGALNADTNDPGQVPDLDLVGGQVTITPRLPLVKILDTAVPMIAINKTIQCTIVNGVLIGPDGQPGVRVVASDSPGIEPFPLQWEVRITINGATTQPAPMVINVPGGQIVNLAVVIPVSPAPPTVTVVSEQSKMDAIAARNAAQLAETNAETAETNAKASETASKNAQTAAETARTGAQTAQTAAETARTQAQTARTDAQTARTGAQTAETNAKAAQTAAEAAKTSSEQARDTSQAISQGLMDYYLDINDRANGYYTNGARTVVDGDSVVLGGTTNNVDGTVNQDRANNWPAHMALASGGRIDLVYNAAVSGQRADQMLARFDANVAPYNPQVVIAVIGTNDMGQGYSRQVWLDNLELYRKKCRAIGATLVVGEIYPSSLTSPVNRPSLLPTWNSDLRVWAKNNGVRVIPFSYFTNPANGGWPTGWSSDQIHPTLLDSREQIGAFAWNSVQDIYDGIAIRPASYFGSGSSANGLFTSKGAVLAVPTISSVGSTASGTLPAGTYSYRITTRNYFGESALSTPTSVTLASAGNVTLSWNTVTGNRGYLIYRRGPNDLDWFRVAEVALATTSWIDNGSATLGERATGIDLSAMPSEFSWGTTTNMKLGGGIFSEPGIKGNYLRMLPLVTNALSSGLLTPTATVAPNEVWEISGLVRGDGQNSATVWGRFRTGTTQVAQVKVWEGLPLPGMQWGRFHLRLKVPASGVDNLLPVLVCNTGNGFVDFAEIRLAKAQ